MGQQQIEQTFEADVAADRLFASAPAWKAQAKPAAHDPLDMQTLNARAVEFIVKPGKTPDLYRCLSTSVLRFLKRQPGFVGASILTPHKEPRLILVFSYWKTETHSRQNQWENAHEVQKAVSPLVDALTRVRTYEASFSESLETVAEPADLQPC